MWLQGAIDPEKGVSTLMNMDFIVYHGRILILQPLRHHLDAGKEKDCIMSPLPYQCIKSV